MSGKRISGKLWAENRDLAESCLKCCFVRGLAEGTLPRAAFKRYVAQDAFYLMAFARAYAFAGAQAPDVAALRTLAGLLNGVCEELKLHAAYARRWRIDLRRVKPLPATVAYTSFLLKTARAGRLGDIFAAMTPCMRLYAYLGQALAAETRGRKHAYSFWIQTYAAPGFEALARSLEALLDAYAEDTVRVHECYRRAMRLERAFFDAPLQAIPSL